MIKEKPVGVGSNCNVIANLWQPQGQIKAGDSVSLKFKAYFVLKDIDVWAKENASLKETMDLGWFSAIWTSSASCGSRVLNEHVTFTTASLLFF